jgi:hypothetical protein
MLSIHSILQQKHKGFGTTAFFQETIYVPALIGRSKRVVDLPKICGSIKGSAEGLILCNSLYRRNLVAGPQSVTVKWSASLLE